jgi:hypothetical protein
MNVCNTGGRGLHRGGNRRGALPRLVRALTITQSMSRPWHIMSCHAMPCHADIAYGGVGHPPSKYRRVTTTPCMLARLHVWHVGNSPSIRTPHRKSSHTLSHQHLPPPLPPPKKQNNRCTSTYTHHIGTINFLADGSMVYGAGDGSHFQGIGAYACVHRWIDRKGEKERVVWYCAWG